MYGLLTLTKVTKISCVNFQKVQRIYFTFRVMTHVELSFAHGERSRLKLGVLQTTMWLLQHLRRRHYLSSRNC